MTLIDLALLCAKNTIDDLNARLMDTCIGKKMLCPARLITVVSDVGRC